MRRAMEKTPTVFHSAGKLNEADHGASTGASLKGYPLRGRPRPPICSSLRRRHEQPPRKQ